jgi:predicted RNA-binding Zn ribbon-like protein
VPDLRFDAGSLALNLVATLGGRHATPVERLDGPGRLRAWCEGVGLPVPDMVPDVVPDVERGAKPHGAADAVAVAGSGSASSSGTSVAAALGAGAGHAPGAAPGAIAGAASDAAPGAVSDSAPDSAPDLSPLLADLRLLREAAYDVAAADLRGAAPSLASVALVNECAYHAPPAPRLELTAAPDAGSRALAVRLPPLTGRHLLSLVARDLLALMADPRLRARLRECEAPRCRMLYLDTTAGGRRRWCSMRVCGNRAKAARHRGLSGAAGRAV